MWVNHVTIICFETISHHITYQTHITIFQSYEDINKRNIAYSCNFNLRSLPEDFTIKHIFHWFICLELIAMNISQKSSYIN